MSSAAAKHRQPRLRASCDGCFLAKVKCSKARPICSRCLACGIECRYSPSSRAGKPKSENTNNHAHHNNHSNVHNSAANTNSHFSHHVIYHQHQDSPTQNNISGITAGFSPMTDDKANLLYAASLSGVVGPHGLFRVDTGWQTPSSMDMPPSSDISGSQSTSSELTFLAMDENAAAVAASAAPGVLYSAGVIPWSTPPTNLTVSQFSSSPIPMASMQIHTAAPSHFSMAATAASGGIPWMDSSVLDMLPCSQGQPIVGHGPTPQQQQMPTPGSIASSSANKYFSSPSTTPSLLQSPAAGHKSVPLSISSSNGGSLYYPSLQNAQSQRSSGNVQYISCACFTACLHALQALHNASTPIEPPFDVVLMLNRNAVEGCASMLACSRCMSRSGTHTAAMLLATLLGNITSFYKTASQLHFGQSTKLRGSMEHSDAGEGRTLSEPEQTSNTAVLTEMVPILPEGSSLSVETAPSGKSVGEGSVSALSISLDACQFREDGRWLELEILYRELKKLEEVYARFREVCGDLLFEDVAVSTAMIDYLGQTLGAVLELVNHRKGDLSFT